MAEESPKTTPAPATETTPAGPAAADTTPDAPTAAETTAAEAEGEHQPADGLMTSARVLAEAAQAAATRQTDKIDKAKVAEAAENVVEAAKSTVTLDDKGGVGQYLNKAQDYLHQMHSGDAGKEETGKDKDKDKDKEKETEAETESGGGSAAGGFMKMAQGFFK